MIDFKSVKEAVSVKEAASFYGIKVIRNGMCCCPFHNDRSPSMKVDKRYYCFACQEKGDVIDFVSKLFSISPKEAAEKLASDFGISAEYDNKEPRPLTRVKSEHEIFAEKKKTLTRMLGDLLETLREIKSEYAPDIPELDMCDSLYTMAIQDYDYVCYLYDYVVFDAMDDVLKTEFSRLEREARKIIGRYKDEYSRRSSRVS